MGIGKSESLIELIHIMESLFQETILGSDINIIRHIFYYLKTDNREIEFIYEDSNYPALVEFVDRDYLTLIIPDFMERTSRRARLLFEALNVQYQFEVQIFEISLPEIKIRTPTELQSFQLRSNRRMLVDDLFMNFTILFRSLSGGSRTVGKNLDVESQFPQIMKEIKKDRPDMKLVNRIVTEHILRVSKEYEMFFFKDIDFLTDLQIYTKKLLESSSKSIYIANCNSLPTYVEKYSHPSLTNFHQLLKNAKPADAESMLEQFEAIHQEESRSFLVSYVVAPIRLYDGIIGTLKVFSTAMDRFKISPAQAEFVHELAEILSYSITKSAIQYGSYETMQATTKVIDISLDGLLFEIFDPRLFHYLKRHNIIKMKLPIDGGHMFTAKGEIVRFLERDNSFHLGVNFFQTAPDDLKHLEEYLYTKGLNILSG